LPAGAPFERRMNATSDVTACSLSVPGAVGGMELAILV
jgi:hypothetical protein